MLLASSGKGPRMPLSNVHSPGWLLQHPPEKHLVSNANRAKTDKPYLRSVFKKMKQNLKNEIE